MPTGVPFYVLGWQLSGYDVELSYVVLRAYGPRGRNAFLYHTLLDMFAHGVSAAWLGQEALRILIGAKSAEEKAFGPLLDQHGNRIDDGDGDDDEGGGDADDADDARAFAERWDILQYAGWIVLAAHWGQCIMEMAQATSYPEMTVEEGVIGEFFWMLKLAFLASWLLLACLLTLRRVVLGTHRWYCRRVASGGAKRKQD